MPSSSPQLAPEPQRNPITDWVLRIGVGLFFLAVGIEKFTAGPKSEWIAIFAKIGWGEWFRYFTGAVETLGALLMLIPRTTIAGTALLASAMMGAILAHCVELGDPFSSIIPLMLLAIIVHARFARNRFGTSLSEGRLGSCCSRLGAQVGLAGVALVGRWCGAEGFGEAGTVDAAVLRAKGKGGADL
jgi:uncharacterized membrane protein YphA (DoxX/SURF4 family)